MTVYLVTYDLNKETKRPDILKVLKEMSWAKLSESSYAVDTEETALQVYNRFKGVIDANDNLYVISLRQPYSGFGPDDVNKWLDARLKW